MSTNQRPIKMELLAHVATSLAEAILMAEDTLLIEKISEPESTQPDHHKLLQAISDKGRSTLVYLGNALGCRPDLVEMRIMENFFGDAPTLERSREWIKLMQNGGEYPDDA